MAEVAGLALTREDIVTLVMAIEEFRDEQGGPHLDANREFAARFGKLLRESGGDKFVLVEADVPPTFFSSENK